MADQSETQPLMRKGFTDEEADQVVAIAHRVQQGKLGGRDDGNAESWLTQRIKQQPPQQNNGNQEGTQGSGKP